MKVTAPCIVRLHSTQCTLLSMLTTFHQRALVHLHCSCCVWRAHNTCSAAAASDVHTSLAVLLLYLLCTHHLQCSCCIWRAYITCGAAAVSDVHTSLAVQLLHMMCTHHLQCSCCIWRAYITCSAAAVFDVHRSLAVNHLVAVNHNQLRTMASETVDPID